MRRQVLNHKLKILHTRAIKQNEKIFREIFINFAKEIETDLKKDLFVEIDFTNLVRNIKRGLKLTRARTTERVLEWTRTLFGWKLKGSSIEAIRNESVEQWMENYSTAKIKGLEIATKIAIKRVIQDGQARGLNTDEITKNIVSRVKEMSVGRAKTIATTETITAINQTTHKTAEEAGMKYKTWNHAGAGKDDRETHLALDGKTIKMNEKFIVNGHEADYPHDPSLPAGEVINCHCFVTYE